MYAVLVRPGSESGSLMGDPAGWAAGLAMLGSTGAKHRNRATPTVGERCSPGTAQIRPSQVSSARQPVVHGRSFWGFRTPQMRLIRSPAMSKAITATVTSSSWSTRPG